jgi:hypothetical protein
VREQRVGLEHHRDVAIGGRQVRDISAADQDRPRGRHFEPGDHAQRRGLAAARRAEQRDQLARLDEQRDVVDGRDLALAVDLGDVPELHRGGVAANFGHSAAS